MNSFVLAFRVDTTRLLASSQGEKSSGSLSKSTEVAKVSQVVPEDEEVEGELILKM
jgi:hypothetical protein